MLRYAILARYYPDAVHVSRLPRFKDELTSPVLVATESMSLNISGSIAGVRLGIVYVTEDAHLGPQYRHALECLKRCIARDHGKIVELH